MESIRLQNYYVKLYIEANKAEINITDLKKKFKEETGKELVLDNYIIGRIKCSINPLSLSFSGALPLKYNYIKFMTPSHFDAKWLIDH